MVKFGKILTEKKEGVEFLNTIPVEWKDPYYPRIITFSGKPEADVRPKVRVRFKDRNKPVFQKDWHKNMFVDVYDPKGTVKKKYRELLIEAGAYNYKEPVSPGLFACYVSYTVPKSLSKPKKKGRIDEGHKVKPDIDNVAKFYMDLLQDITMPSDQNISALRCEKMYGEMPGAMLMYFPVVNCVSYQFADNMRELFIKFILNQHP